MRFVVGILIGRSVCRGAVKYAKRMFCTRLADNLMFLANIMCLCNNKQIDNVKDD